MNAEKITASYRDRRESYLVRHLSWEQEQFADAVNIGKSQRWAGPF